MIGSIRRGVKPIFFATVLTLPLGIPSSSSDLKTIFSVLPDTNVLVRFFTGILPLGLVWKQILIQLLTETEIHTGLIILVLSKFVVFLV